jgi:hypothetical protein
MFRRTFRMHVDARLATLFGLVIAVIAAPIALALPIQGGQRNPGNRNLAFSRQTQLWAANSAFALRVSNLGSGGAVVDGCRNVSGGPPCVEVVGLKTGPVFQFIGGGSVGGTIQMSNPNAAPFTTNATGVATGLNANFLQGHQASDFLAATAQAADSAKLGGVPAGGYVQTSQLTSAVQSQLGAYAQQSQILFADVSTNGTLGNNRGATSATSSGTNYTVTFSGNVSKCAYTASPVGVGLASGQIGVAPDTSNPDTVDVDAPGALTQGFDLQVTC